MSSEVPYLHAMSAEMMGKDQGNAFKFEVKRKKKIQVNVKTSA